MKNRFWQQIIAMILLTAMFAMNVMPMVGAEASGTTDPAKMKFEDYEGLDYNLESFLNGYNVLSFGNLTLDNHCMGALLVQGDFEMIKAAGYADGKDLPPSYIAGSIRNAGSYNNRNEKNRDPLYAGSSNAITYEYDQGQWKYMYKVNGVVTGDGGATPAYNSDIFFDFAKALEVVRNYGTAMAKSGTVVKPDGNGKITINAGSQVIIESLKGVNTIDIVGNTAGTANTIISILQQDNISYMPEIKHNGADPKVVEQSTEGTAIVWNFPNATKLVTPSGNWVGHVIAPDAEVTHASGNYNGCYVCKSFAGAAEGHVYPYSGGVLPGNPDAPETPDTPTVETITISGSKTWNDDNNRDGKRPSSITINLLKDGAVVASKPVTEADGWKWEFSEMPKFDENGKQITYTITENAVAGYTAVVSGYNVTNTHEIEKTTISGNKTWNDDSNRDGKRPGSITVRLYANGTEVSSQTVTASNNWSWSFVDFPKYENGVEITYTIAEDSVANYSTQINGNNIVNNYNTEKVTISGSKTWNDDNNRDGKRPSSITVNLLANGSKVASQTITASNNWTWTFNDLHAYENGNRINYTITEEAVAGYTADVNGYDITNSHQPEMTSVSGSKTWNDNDDQDGKRPSSITVNLLANGSKVASQTVTASNNWSWTFDNLYKYENGKEIVYSVTEDAVKDYTPKVEGYNITNTYETETTSVSGSKTWNDNDDQDGKRPERITIRLYANGTEVDSKTVTANDNWSWNFTGLDKYADGQEITYTISEDKVEGYTDVISGYNVTNTHTPEKTSVSGSKTWNDNLDQDGKRPESIIIRLYADGAEVRSKIVTAADNWAWSFTGLDKFSGGQEIVYTITEDDVVGYTPTVSGYDVTNTHTIEKITISGGKNWVDANNQDGKRPESITINLLADGVEVAEQTVTAANGWTWSFAGLDKYADGKEINYTITEDEVEGYTPTVSGYNVTNTYEPEKITVSGSKTWDDADDQDGKRPESITINLLANGTVKESKVITAADSWKWSFTGLDRYSGGKAISYTITENAVEGYTATVSGYNVTNTHEIEKVTVSGSKTWDDADDQDGKRPDSITINLLADGTVKESRVVTADDDWAWSFTGLDKYAGGQEITYTITEDTVADYTTEIDGFNVTNTHEIEKVSISGSKTWNDADDQDGKRPVSININLLADGAEVAQQTINETDDWKWTFSDFPKYANGKEIKYTVTEDKVEGYTTVVNGYDITNTYEPESTSVIGSKTWDDDNNRDGIRPSLITIRLYADGKEIDSMTVTADDDWAWSFTGLPRYAAGKEIVYTIAEVAVDGYTSSVSGYNLTNTHEPEKINVGGSKTWDDAENQDGKRPESIVINLLANGEKIDSCTVTAENGWKWSFNDLLKNENGAPIVYTITEDAVADYTTEIIGYNAVNTHEPETTVISGSKTWEDANNQDGIRPESIIVRLLADGEEIDRRTVTAADNWAWSFENLPSYKDGKLINYNLLEEAVEGYTTIVSGGNIINTHTVELTDVKVTKVWNDDNDKYGFRPDSITVQLYADGNAVGEPKTIAADANGGWSAEWNALPKNANGRAIVYTAAELPVENYTANVVNNTNGIVITNSLDAPSVSISKREISGVDELPGAVIKITLVTPVNKDDTLAGVKGSLKTELSKDAKEISWTSVEKNANKLWGMPAGEYTFTEITAPNGYEVAETIRFKINSDKSVSVYNAKTEKFEAVDNKTVVMYDAPITANFSKQEAGGGPELKGAELIIKPVNKNTKLDGVMVPENVTKENNTIKWVSGDKPTEIGKLPEGEYTLTEITAPDGYEVAETIKFRVNSDASVSVYNTEKGKYEDVTENTVVMFDAPVKATFSKQEAGGGPELAGAKLEIKPAEKGISIGGVEVPEGVTKDTKNNVITWVSGNSPVSIGMLPAGEYTLTEITAPKGYEVAETIRFKINDNHTVSVYDAEKEEFVLVDENTVVMFDAPSDAKFSKQAAGGGFELEGAKLEIKPTSRGVKIDDVEVPDGVTKDTKNNIITWTSGKTPIEIGALPEGNYLLTEITAPAGYEIAETIKFRVNSDNTISVYDSEAKKYVVVDDNTVVMYDEPSSAVSSEGKGMFSFTKRSNKGMVLSGAEFRLQGSNYNKSIVTTESGVVSFVNIPEGTYTLVEVNAPVGYTKSESVITVVASKEGIITFKDAAGNTITLGELEKAMINDEKISAGPTTTTAAPTTTTFVPTTTTNRNLGMVFGDGDRNNPNYVNPSMGDESGKSVQIALIGLSAAAVIMLGCVVFRAVRRKNK